MREREPCRRHSEHEPEEEGGGPRGPREHDQAEGRQGADGREQAGPAGHEVGEGVVVVAEHGQRPAELGTTSADADVEAGCEHEVRAPHRQGRDDHDGERDERGKHRQRAAQTQRGDVGDLDREHERAVLVACERQVRRRSAECPAPGRRALERPEECQERERAREQKQAVHAPVDPVEEGHPAGRDEDGRDQAGAAPREACSERGADRDARHRKDRRDQPQRGQRRGEPGGDVDEEEMQGRAATLAEHRAEERAERLAADEQRERLVLVGWPRVQPRAEERGDPGRGRGGAEDERSARQLHVHGHEPTSGPGWHCQWESAKSIRVPW